MTPTSPPQPAPDRSTRDGFGDALVEAAKTNPQIVGLCADLTESTRMEKFAQTFPDRFIEVGVAEQNLIGVAAGLALGGKLPVAASYAVFSPGRSWDQLRVSVCYSNLNVKIIGGHTGITVGPDGATHQAMEDIAMTRVLPNLTVLVPADYQQAYQATLAMLQLRGPCYLRLGRDKVPPVTSATDRLVIGKAQLKRPGKHVTIVACGIMVAAALQAADALAEDHIDAEVINLASIKPLDGVTLIKSVEKTGALVTAEEHQLAGGMGSAVIEVLAQHQPVPVEMVGVKDTFGESGSSAELLAKYRLTANDIVKAVWKVLERKR